MEKGSVNGEVEDIEKVIPSSNFGKNYAGGNTCNKNEVILGVLGAVFIFLTILMIVLLGVRASQSPPPEQCVTKGCLREASNMIRLMNASVDPCTDFHTFACGNYPKFMQIGSSSTERTVIQDAYLFNQRKIMRILFSPIQRNVDWSYERKVKDFYKSCTSQYNTERLKGMPLINMINNNDNGRQLGPWYVFDNSMQNWNFQSALEKIHVDFWANALFSIKVESDIMDTSRTKKGVIEIDQNGMGLMNNGRPGIYFWTGTWAQMVQAAYRDYMRQTARLLVRDNGMDPNDANVNRSIEQFVADVYQFEMQLANVSRRTGANKNPYHMDNRKTISNLNKIAGQIDWLRLFQYMFGTTVTSDTNVVLLELNYLRRMSTMLANMDPNSRDRVLNNYLHWQLMRTYTEDLSSEYIHATRTFRKARSGQRTNYPISMLCFGYMTEKMGDALGALFVQDHFTDNKKDRVEAIVSNLKQTIVSRLQEVTWMDEPTKKFAREKMAAIVDKIAYDPSAVDHFFMDRKYDALKVNVSDFIGNILSVNAFEKATWTKYLTQGRQKTESDDITLYQAVVRFFNPWNEIIVPAGMFQFPVYTYPMPMHSKYGGLGSLIAQNLLHAVDEYGLSTGKDGSLQEWWSNATYGNYLQKKQCIIDYYTGKTVSFILPGDNSVKSVPVNGETLAVRSMASSGGVRTAYYAYKNWVGDNSAEKQVPGLGRSNDQAFFIAFAQLQCFNRRPTAGYANAINGFYPEDFRVNNYLAHVPEFTQAFNCPAKSAMNPEKKCVSF
ncbi:endothelin-converting enzyme 1 [Lingula anatina]|uniref:Endothelin-converting enzyme 1 n=1 Tax=Lingula anatina TaxID=7574 RepID=A0A1S3ILF7_LINAN|nr:endothelin-converting enzyme 1 [Lingula anatina]|eukprot:XP_013399075.1 endothelin-converting enzyme 1 [Lingula anatina]